MKHCFKCNTNKPKTEFGKNKAKHDGLQSQCKICRKETNNAYYAASEQRRETIKRNRQKEITYARNYITGIKNASVCIRCGETENCTLDFHHKDPSTKEFSIAYAVGRISLSKIKKEILKCEILCANCHRKLHNGLF